jgi:rare lipoprotein A
MLSPRAPVSARPRELPPLPADAGPPPRCCASADANGVPDAVPRIEPRSRYGNPPFYDVFGKRYYVLSSSVGYWERGRRLLVRTGLSTRCAPRPASPTTCMRMTAAHKTLPLPAYVRVTNLQNGRSVVVRVNDRGPFVGNRIIDLSYSAAAKLDMVRNGTAFVEVRSIDRAVDASTSTSCPAEVLAPIQCAEPRASRYVTVPRRTRQSGGRPAAPVNGRRPLFVQAGAFSDPANAQRLATNCAAASYGKVFVRDDQIAGRKMYRVRIGPVPDVAEFDRVVAALERAGINDAHLALD